MKIKSLLVCGSMAVLGAAFTSCSKDIAFDSEGATQRLYAEYEANFVKKYGAIDPNQTWDFASMRPVRTLPSTATRAGETRGATVNLKSTGTLILDGGKGSIFEWLNKNLPAGQNHSQVGSPFKAVMTRNTFVVVPFYQGCASYFWELWVNIDGKEYKIWEKYDELKYKLDGDPEDGWRSLTTAGMPANVVKVKAPTYTYTATEGSQLFFFMKVWKDGDSAHTSDGSGSIILSSLDNGNMRALQSVKGLPRPANVPDDYFAYLIGCEDGAPDGDYEDLGFLFYGPPISEVEEVEVRETKRYMMEDLGATDDFDFNDVVVDVSNVWKKQITRKENASTGEVFYNEKVIEGSQRQEAIVRAAGGIYDFTLTIGDTSWKKSDKLTVSTMWNTGLRGAIDYNAELAKFDVNGWNKDANNITLTVDLPDGPQSAGQVTIQFPRKGTAPKMIAVDATEEWNWMEERQSVPGGTNSQDDWWYWPQD